MSRSVRPLCFQRICLVAVTKVRLDARMVQIERKPIFFVVKKGSDEWCVEAEWPDGTIEKVKAFKAELEAINWLSWQSRTWLEWRHTDFSGAS